MIYLKPAAGRAVPDPDKGGMLAEAGRWVEPSQYWLRRLADGDAEEAEPPPDTPEPAPPPHTAADLAAVAVSEPVPRKARGRATEESQP